MENEFISLFTYLGKPAGVLGKEVYAAAKAGNEKVGSEDVVTPRFAGKILTYRREFLDKFFKKEGVENNGNNDDLPF